MLLSMHGWDFSPFPIFLGLALWVGMCAFAAHSVVAVICRSFPSLRQHYGKSRVVGYLFAVPVVILLHLLAGFFTIWVILPLVVLGIPTLLLTRHLLPSNNA